MKLRKLRIAWSVAWGSAAVLLILMLVRSYRVWDSPYTTAFREVEIQANSLGGYLYLGAQRLPGNQKSDAAWDTFGRGRFTEYGAECASLEWILTSQVGALGVGTCKADGYRFVYAPYWLLAAIAGVMAWVPWRRTAPRFSLRTLLIATTLIAIGLGLAAWHR